MGVGVALIPGGNDGLILAAIPALSRRNCRIFADDGHDHSRPLCACEDLPQEDRGLDVVIAYGYTCACFKDHNPWRSLNLQGA